MKIVIAVKMNDEETRRKALQTVSSFPGIRSVALKGERRNQIELKGEAIDAVNLTRKLRKKVALAVIVEQTTGDDDDTNRSNNDNRNNRYDANNNNIYQHVVAYPHGLPYTHNPIAPYNENIDHNNDVGYGPCCIIM